MAFTKALLKKELAIDEEGLAAEVIIVSLKYEIHPGQEYQDVRARLIQRLDQQFNEMFSAELGLMPQRIEEGERWHQQSLFADDVIREAANTLRDMGSTIHVGSSDGDEEDEE